MGWEGGCEACKRPAMVFLLCDGWLEGCTGLICMRREARKGEKRGLFNEACHPKPPSCTKPHTPLLYQPSLYPFVIPPRPLFFLFISVLPFHFVVFICLSSLFLSLSKSYTLPSTLLPSLPLDFIPLNFCSFRFSFLSVKLFTSEFHKICILSLIWGYCKLGAKMKNDIVKAI